VSELLQSPPFSERDDALLLRELNELTQWHLSGCPAYQAMWPGFSVASSLAELPFVHVGVFKHLLMRTTGNGINHQRILKSSSTSGVSSQIPLDTKSGDLQSKASVAVLEDLVGAGQRPLLVTDCVKSLQQRGEVSARVTAAMSLRPLSTEMHFLLKASDDAQSLDWSLVEVLCQKGSPLLVYGFTWMLWAGWVKGQIPEQTKKTLGHTKVHFVHSGGWKKLEAAKVDRATFDQSLLAMVGDGSGVVDFYGLVEQVGMIYPLCEAGFRHVPRWGAVLVRDPWTLETKKSGEEGMLQLMNPLAHGAPYHSVLTEDMGCIIEGDCPCGRQGVRFELHGRMPKSEVRGCANV
jgi:hypothetical protein